MHEFSSAQKFVPLRSPIRVINLKVKSFVKSETIVKWSERNCDQQMIKMIGIKGVRTLKQSNLGNTFEL